MLPYHQIVDFSFLLPRRTVKKPITPFSTPFNTFVSLRSNQPQPQPQIVNPTNNLPRHTVSLQNPVPLPAPHRQTALLFLPSPQQSPHTGLCVIGTVWLVLFGRVRFDGEDEERARWYAGGLQMEKWLGFFRVTRFCIFRVLLA